VVDGVHLVLVFKEVVFVDVLDLEFVVLGAARFDAELVVEHLVGVFSRLEAARTDR